MIVKEVMSVATRLSEQYACGGGDRHSDRRHGGFVTPVLARFIQFAEPRRLALGQVAVRQAFDRRVDAIKLSLQDGLALAYQDFLKFR